MDYEPLTLPLRIVCFGARDVQLVDELLVALVEADLVIALGDVDLDRIADALPKDKPALCVLGDHDPRRPPPLPFNPLHGSGVSFRGWRVVGLSGGVTGRSDGDGFTLTEEEALSALQVSPPSDILITHAAPAGFESEIGVEPALRSISAYIEEYQPLYHLHANSLGESSTLIGGHTLAVGVDGALILPSIDLSAAAGAVRVPEGF